MTTILYFFWDGFAGVAAPVAATTSRPFYRPIGVDVAHTRLGAAPAVADVLAGRVDVADTRRLSTDEQVQ